jgi:hypothetical protein
MAHPGEPRPELVLRIHVRILAEPLHFTIEEMVEGARRVYATAGVRVEVGSVEWIDVPRLRRYVSVGTCSQGALTPDQDLLFAVPSEVPAGEVVIYFVAELEPRMHGCAAHPVHAPGAVIANTATRWTLAHELGHVLGIGHVHDVHRLMTGSGTESIPRAVPLLVPSEIRIVRASSLLRETRSE